MRSARPKGPNPHEQFIVGRAWPSDALLSYQNKFLECFDVIFKGAFVELFQTVLPSFSKLPPQAFAGLEKDVRLPYAALWKLFRETNNIYLSTLEFDPEETLTQSADAAKRLLAWSEPYQLNYPWVLGAALYIMLGWKREGTREHRCGTLAKLLLKATDETCRETTYFSMSFELLPHPKAPWARPADWLCYRAPSPLPLLLPALEFGYARPAPWLTKDVYLRRLLPGLTERVTLAVEQNRLLRRFLHLTDETRKAEWVEEQEHFFRQYFGRYYDRVAAHWQRLPDTEAIVPLHRRENPLTQMYWTVYAVVKSATTNEIREFAAKRDELRRTLCKNDNIRKAVRDYCSVLQFNWTPKRGRPRKPKDRKKKRK